MSAGDKRRENPSRTKLLILRVKKETADILHRESQKRKLPLNAVVNEILEKHLKE